MSVDTQPHVAARRWKTPFDEPRQESRLEATSHHRAALQRVSPGSQDGAQTRGSPPASTSKDSIDLFDVECSQDRCLLDETPHRVPAGPSCHVHQSPGNVGAWDSIACFSLVGQRRANVVPADTGDLAARPIGRDDIDHVRLLIPQADQLRRAAVGHDRPLFACQTCRTHPAQLTDRPMPNSERPPDESVQVAALHTKRDLPVAQSKSAKLPPRHNPMLTPRQPGNRMIHASGARFALHGCIRRTGAGFALPHRAGGGICGVLAGA